MELLGIGTALPPHRIAQADAATIARRLAAPPEDRADLFDDLYQHVGVATRHSVLLRASDGPLEDRQAFYEAASPPSTAARMAVYRAEAEGLALASASRALAASGVEAGQITHLVTVSCTGFSAPGVDLALARRLPLPASVARTHVGFMGCQGAMNGLRVAGAFAASGPSARVLLCATELCSLHHAYGWDLETIVANALFADGSAAAVISGAEAGPGGLRLVASGSTILEGSAEAMTWIIGDHGFAMSLSPRVPRMIARSARGWLADWLGSLGRSLDEVRTWAVHPGGPRILGAFRESLGLPAGAVAASTEVLANHGNMSSATILFVLKSLIDAGAEPPLVAIAFGPGLSVEAALFDRS